MGDANAQPRKTRLEGHIASLAPSDRPPRLGRKAEGKILDLDRLVLGIAAQLFGRPAAAPDVRLGRQGPGAGRPHGGVRQNARDVGQPQRRDGCAQIDVRAIARIHQHHAARQARRTGRADLIERDLRLGLKADLLGHARLLAAGSVRGPALRQIQAIGHRQARMSIGQRQRHCDLAIVLLAELAAILPGHAHRMRALLGKARVIDDPGLDRPMSLDRRQNHLANFCQHPLVRPAPLADKMQQRLMLRRRRHRSHRLHALALARQHQALTVIPQWLGPVGVTDHAHKFFDIRRKTRLTVLLLKIHLSPRMLKKRIFSRYVSRRAKALWLSDSVRLERLTALSRERIRKAPT